MATYLEVIDGVAVGGLYDDSCEGFIVPDSWVDITSEDPQPSIGWEYDGSTWSDPTAETTRQAIRQSLKDGRLKKVDEEIQLYLDTKELVDAGVEGASLSMSAAAYQDRVQERVDLRNWDVTGTDDIPTKPTST